jgi:hypothetical protein
MHERLSRNLPDPKVAAQTVTNPIQVWIDTSPALEHVILKWKQPALSSGEAIRQKPREERIGNTAERGDAAGARRTATRRAVVFCVHTLSLWTGSSPRSARSAAGG